MLTRSDLHQTKSAGLNHSVLAGTDRHLLAVSGGGDSMALLHLMDAWRREASDQRHIEVASVDHGLRAEAIEEIELVAQRCAELGLTHHVLTLDTPPHRAIQASARTGRYRLLATCARNRNLGSIVTAHHSDDQAETIRMRLNRDSGIAGLAGMRAQSVFDGVAVLRPLLDCRCDELTAIAQACGPFASDPSNEDERYDRVRVRTAMGPQERSRLLRIGERAARLRAKRDRATAAAFDHAASVSALGHVEIDPARLRDIPPAQMQRLFAQALTAVSGNAHQPARSALIQLIETVLSGKDATLSGCHVIHRRGSIWICREAGREGFGKSALPDGEWALWNDRIAVCGVAPDRGIHVAAMAETAKSHYPDLPALIREAMPGVYREAELIGWPAETAGCFANGAGHYAWTGLARLALIGVTAKGP